MLHQIDIVTIIPIFLSIALSSPSESVAKLNFLRVIRVVRLSRVLGILKRFGGVSPVNRSIAALVMSVVIIIFVAAGAMFVVENNPTYAAGEVRDPDLPPFTFGNSVYFVIVTIVSADSLRQ